MSKEERIQEQWTRVEDGLPMVKLEPQTVAEPIDQTCHLCGDQPDHKCGDGYSCMTCCTLWGELAGTDYMHAWIDRIWKHITNVQRIHSSDTKGL